MGKGMNLTPILVALTELVVTIDGSGNRSDPSLKPWALSIGSYVENVTHTGAAVTDPSHGTLYGSGDVGRCLNFEGFPVDPMHFELLRAQQGVDSAACVLVSAKDHLLAFSRHSDFYGDAFSAVTIHVETDTIRCGLFADNVTWEGPDSLAIERCIAYMDTVLCRFVGLNLAATDQWGHSGLSCLGGDYPAYVSVWDSTFQAAVRLVRERLWPWIQSQPEYAGQTAMLLTTDHGFHSVGLPFAHGHGYQDSVTCEPNCSGCADLWAIFAGPGVRVGVEATGNYVIDDLAPTMRFLGGFSNPFEVGSPIVEVLAASGLPTTFGGYPRETRDGLFDVTGRAIEDRSALRSGVYLERKRGEVRKLVIIR